MDFKDLITKIESSTVFKDVLKKTSDLYLAHVFTIMDAQQSNEWDFGYYSKRIDRIIVFKWVNDIITVLDPQEVFKESGYVDALTLDAIKISKEKAMTIAQKIIKENYSAESLMNAIVLLQNLKGYGQVWNITLTTQTFHVINIKVNAESGEVIKHSKESLIGWNKK